MNADLKIENKLLAKGASPFWVNSSMQYIRQLLTGNKHFTTSVNNIRVTVGPHGVVKSVTAKVERIFPDDGNRTESARIKYTFNPKVKMAHKGWLNA